MNVDDWLIGIGERGEFITQVKQIAGVPAGFPDWIDDLLDLQEQLIGRRWWQFTPDDQELVLHRLRADQEKTAMVLHSYDGGVYRVKVPKRIATLIGGEAVTTLEQFIEAMERECSYAEFTVAFGSRRAVELIAQEATND